MKNLAEINPEHRLYFRDVIQEIRAAVRKRRTAEADRLLGTLDRQLEERFKDYRSRAQAIADANSRAVEILDQQISLNQELERQNEMLRKERELFADANISLETQGRSAANATAKAVIRLDRAEDAIRRLDAMRSELHVQNRLMKQSMDALKKEATALAMANVQAVLMIENKELAIAELRDKVEAKGKKRASSKSGSRKGKLIS